MNDFFLGRRSDHHSKRTSSASSGRHLDSDYHKPSSHKSHSSVHSTKTSSSGSETRYKLHIYYGHSGRRHKDITSSPAAERPPIVVFNLPSKSSSRKGHRPSSSHLRNSPRSRSHPSGQTIPVTSQDYQYFVPHQSHDYQPNMSSPYGHNPNTQADGSNGGSLPMPGLSGRANGPIGNLVKGPVDSQGRLKDAALMVGVKLDVEAEVHLTARVRGDVLVGLY